MQTVSPRKLLTLLLALVAGLVLFQQSNKSCLAQSSTSVETRETPAPWRPSFGQINREAVEAQEKSAFDLSRPADLGSNLGSSNRNQDNSTGAAREQNDNRNQSPVDNRRADPESPAETAPSLQAKSNPNDSRFGQVNGVTRVTKNLDKLPNAAGQVWREYNISPYTSQIKTIEDPQRAITEWVLRETGTEMWFAEPLGILHANKEHLYVYHTPEIHRVVKGIVDRFVQSRGHAHNIDVNLVTVEKPNWRSQSYTMLQPIEVKSPGVEAWMVSKENAAILLGQLSRRGDFKQHSGGRLTNHDGQSFVMQKTKPVQFVRSIQWVPNQVPNYQPLLSKLDEGFRLSISCLSSLDDNSIEAVVKCDCDQIEKLSTVKVNVPGASGGSETINLQIPQLVSWRVHERFRWPNDQVLLLSCGVVATPGSDSGTGLRLPGITKNDKRGDALLFIEYRGPATGSGIGTKPPQTAQNRLAPVSNNRR